MKGSVEPGFKMVEEHAVICRSWGVSTLFQGCIYGASKDTKAGEQRYGTEQTRRGSTQCSTWRENEMIEPFYACVLHLRCESFEPSIVRLSHPCQLSTMRWKS
eukprot:3505616-Amphidinium_carterae.1